MPAPASSSPLLPESGSFHTTHWSLVAGARATDEPAARAALEHLCCLYWAPLYSWARHRGHGTHDAQDLVQEFFARLLEHRWLAAAHPDKGRFRSFLLMAMKRFMANEWDRDRAVKRGGGVTPLSLDVSAAESLLPASAPADPDAAFDRGWALTLLDKVVAALRDELHAAGRARDYQVLRPWLTAPRGDVPYHEIARNLSMSEASARSALHRLRRRFRDRFREAVAATVADPADVDDEVRALVAALAAG